MRRKAQLMKLGKIVLNLGLGKSDSEPNLFTAFVDNFLKIIGLYSERPSVEFNATVDGVLVMDAMKLKGKEKVEKYLPECKEFSDHVVKIQNNTYGYPPGPHVTYACGYDLFLKPPSIGNP